LEYRETLTKDTVAVVSQYGIIIAQSRATVNRANGRG